MRLRKFCFPLLVATLIPLPVLALNPLSIDSRQYGWAMYLHTPEGYPYLTLRGDEVQHPENKDQIDVKDLNVLVYSGTAASSITTILLSPQASFFPKEERASGAGTVRVIRDDCDITGEDWTFERAGEKVSIRHHGRIVINAALNGLLQ